MNGMIARSIFTSSLLFEHETQKVHSVPCYLELYFLNYSTTLTTNLDTFTGENCCIIMYQYSWEFMEAANIILMLDS